MTELLQAIVVGLVQGALYGLLAAGLGLIIAVTKRFHFAMATTFVLAVWIAAMFAGEGVPTLLAIVLGLAAGMLAGVLIEALIYAPIVARAPQAALLSVFVAALGVVIATENVVRLLFEGTSRQIDPGFAPKRLTLLGDVGLSNVDLLAVCVSVALVVALWVLLRRSGFGRAIRAVEENPDMATAVGVSPRRVCYAVFAIGSLLIGAAAMLYGMRSAVPPDGGAGPTFITLVVVFLAGVRSSPLRFGVAGVAVGVAESLATVYVSASWSSVVVFGILFAYVVSTPYLPALRARVRRNATAAGTAGG